MRTKGTMVRVDLDLLVVDVDDGLVREVGRDSEVGVLLCGEIKAFDVRRYRSLGLDDHPAVVRVLDAFDYSVRNTSVQGRRSERRGTHSDLLPELPAAQVEPT